MSGLRICMACHIKKCGKIIVFLKVKGTCALCDTRSASARSGAAELG